MTGATINKIDKRYISLTLDTTLHPQATNIINNILEDLEDIKAAKEAKAEGGERISFEQLLDDMQGSGTLTSEAVDIIKNRYENLDN